jgi:CDP-4-dehydro-6-deoxyglucose reductase
MPNANKTLHTAILRRSSELCPGTKHLEFELTSAPLFDFAAGQFISLAMAFGGKTYTRAYSIASAPNGSPRFDLCLNRVQDGRFSNYLCDLAAGATIEFEGPLGFFTLPQIIERDQLFIATGTGIAPIRAMLHQLLRNPITRQVDLIFGVRYPHTILYREEFERLSVAHPNFRFIPTLSRPPADWTGAVGHVQKQIETLLGGRSDFDAYICGLKLMVDDVRQQLKAMGLDRRQIHYEKYD